MSFIFSFIQLWAWIGVGYFWHAKNGWAQVACVFFALLMGLASAMDTVGKELRNRGITNQSK
jgi:hypothetical protein